MRSHMFSALIIVALGCLGFAGAGHAGEASVLDVQVRANEDGTYAFTATVSHRDEGWTHYADKWKVLSPTGDILGTRTLYHPHVDEQPFTRSLGRVEIPIGVTSVTVRAYDNVHGAGTRTFTVDLPPRK